MRQLMYGDRRPRRTGLVEVLAVHLVVAAEVVHVHQVRRDADQVLQARADRAQDVADVLDDRAGLLADVQRRGAERVDLGTGDRVVGPPAAGPGQIREAARHLHVRVPPPRRRLPLHHLRVGHPRDRLPIGCPQAPVLTSDSVPARPYIRASCESASTSTVTTSTTGAASSSARPRAGAGSTSAPWPMPWAPSSEPGVARTYTASSTAPPASTRASTRPVTSSRTSTSRRSRQPVASTTSSTASTSRASGT